MNRSKLIAIANRQYGVFSRAQALDAGMSKDAIIRRVAGGEWIRVLPGVYRLAAVVVTEAWKQRAMAALPLPVAQFVIEHDGKFVARVDFAYPDRKLYHEADSVEVHTGTQQWQSDLKRQNRLAAIGWRPLRAFRDQLRDTPEEFVGELRTALGEASLQ